MRKIFASLLLLLATLCCFWGCEKDDICADGTATTPNLIITLLNQDNQTERKAGNIQYFMDVDGEVNLIGPSVTDSIVVPLRTDVNTVRWGFTLITTGTGGTSNYNTDYLEFNYTRNDIYVSRACGYKTFFYLDDDTTENLNPTLTDTVPADNLWIQDVIITRNNVEDEESAHVQIYY
ncbi:DUF6452 family protein [Flavobacterium litorale]|uniref:Uncharacterized protein n=1 Tax=Flavobacterium litorale TaxID=2856519 RepID=A0ABX8V578_9FLAO|nr:DUF6452 family protein [Flavobacterium litorale]QYJ67998.1 hypothetical protein K1I41_10735 [Flavobacterium litorale]